ncbi:hypothetical protein QL285_009618 [Trifolium repens]|nr:hypothetical protein QL285_009618 [Trifolium repens]
MALELLFQANRFIGESALDNKEVPTLCCYQAVKKNLGPIWGNRIRTSFNHGAHSLRKVIRHGQSVLRSHHGKRYQNPDFKDLINQFKTLLNRANHLGIQANQKQTLMTRGRSHEDPVGPANHVSEWLNLGAYLSERENQYQ